MQPPDQLDRASNPWRPTASWSALRLRAELLARLREFFTKRGFLEVETPLLSADTVVDRYLEPLPVEVAGRRMYLQTSPEFGMKRLLTAGATAIYQVCRAFRAGEKGRRHNLEFTMVEWYRVGDSYRAAQELLAELAQEMLGLGGAEFVSYREAFLEHAGVDPLRAPLEALAAAAHARGVRAPESLSAADRDGWLNLLLAELVEPRLGRAGPTILYDYPASQAALAIVREEKCPVAERFELYVRGVELANGYHELLDPAALLARNRQNNVLRAQDGRARLPEESHLLTAMEAGLPPCCGVALGFDRLVMLAAGADEIASVMAFPADRA